MMKVKVKFPDLSELGRNTRFLLAKALTLTARDAAAAVKTDMPRRFLLRRSWVHKGIRFDMATREGLTARVYSVDPYMTKQEKGETYRPHGSHVAVPFAVRPFPKANIPRGLLPKALLKDKSVFKAEIRGKLGLWQRKPDRKIRLLYLLKNEKMTKARWDFEDTVREVASRTFDKHFNLEKGE